MPNVKGDIKLVCCIILLQLSQGKLAELRCQSYLEQCSLRKLRSLEELNGFRTTDSSIFVLVSHSEPIVKQIDVCHQDRGGSVSCCADAKYADTGISCSNAAKYSAPALWR